MVDTTKHPTLFLIHYSLTYATGYVPNVFSTEEKARKYMEIKEYTKEHYSVIPVVLDSYTIKVDKEIYL